MTQFIQAERIGTVPAIPNAFATAGLDTAILTDPQKIQAFKDTIASQMNAQSGGPKFVDLSSRIAGIRRETSAQGASILVVSVIDPLWVLLMSGFIQADENGYLWPPIDVHYPTGTDCVWRLCQVRAVWSTEMTEANLTLTFEDRIVSLLREMSAANGGISQGQPNQTLGGFIKQLVDSTNRVLKLKPGIRLVEMISPDDPNYTVPINNLPASAQAPLGKQPLRTDPLKQNQGPSRTQQMQLEQIQQNVAKLFGITPGGLAGPVGGPLTLSEIEAGAAELMYPAQSSASYGTGPNAGQVAPPPPSTPAGRR